MREQSPERGEPLAAEAVYDLPDLPDLPEFPYGEGESGGEVTPERCAAYAVARMEAAGGADDIEFVQDGSAVVVMIHGEAVFLARFEDCS